ncbi:hypothetical protein D1872_336620 [compost metagenome]
MRKIRVIDGVWPNLRFQAETRKGAVVTAIEAGNRDVQFKGRIKLYTGFGGVNL